eukprot:761301-Hanusia_phi.AAC.3
MAPRFTITLNGGKVRGQRGGGDASWKDKQEGFLSASMRKALGVNAGGAGKSASGKQLANNDLRLKLSGNKGKPKALVSKSAQRAMQVEQKSTSDEEGKWVNDMYYKSGQSDIVTNATVNADRPASYLVHATNSKNKKVLSKQIGTATGRLLHKAGVFQSKDGGAGDEVMKVEQSGSKSTAVKKKGRGAFTYPT